MFIEARLWRRTAQPSEWTSQSALWSAVVGVYPDSRTAATRAERRRRRPALGPVVPPQHFHTLPDLQVLLILGMNGYPSACNRQRTYTCVITWLVRHNAVTCVRSGSSGAASQALVSEPQRAEAC